MPKKKAVKKTGGRKTKSTVGRKGTTRARAAQPTRVGRKAGFRKQSTTRRRR